MTPGEFRQFAEAMREFGLTRIKIGDVVMIMNSKSIPIKTPAIASEPNLTGGIPADPDPIKHRVEELASLMKLNDTDLVDKLFPDHTEEESV